MPDRSKLHNYSLWIAIALVVLYVGAGGAGKLASVPYVHSSFPSSDYPHGSVTSSARAKC